jgi:hypothetical protein
LTIIKKFETWSIWKYKFNLNLLGDIRHHSEQKYFIVVEVDVLNTRSTIANCDITYSGQPWQSTLFSGMGAAFPKLSVAKRSVPRLRSLSADSWFEWHQTGPNKISFQSFLAKISGLSGGCGFRLGLCASWTLPPAVPVHQTKSHHQGSNKVGATRRLIILQVSWI